MTDTQPSMPARFDFPVRAASGLVLAVVAIAAVMVGGTVFAAFVAVAAVAALREWHRLVNGGRFAREMIPTAIAAAVAVWLAGPVGNLDGALLVILLGAGASALVFALRGRAERWPMPWHALGALYVGLPVIALAVLRSAPRGAAIVGALFVAVWAADTGALLFGRLFGGPKLVPVLSPNKTWAGFLGGTLAAMLAEAVYVLLLNGSVPKALIFGGLLALSAHCGDLFESWVKRQFHAKDMGHLIPGHGGILDRIDSVLFAAPVCVALLFLAGLDPLGGARP